MIIEHIALDYKNSDLNLTSEKFFLNLVGFTDWL